MRMTASKPSENPSTHERNPVMQAAALIVLELALLPAGGCHLSEANGPTAPPPAGEERTGEVPIPPAAPGRKGGVIVHSTAASPEDEPLIAAGGDIPSNTVECLKRWQKCDAPYNPGTWGARVTYHCPKIILPFEVVIPGTTRSAYVMIPDEYIGKGPKGADLYQCRTKAVVDALLKAADATAKATTRATQYPTADACHAGFRANLLALLNTSFTPSGGGRPSGVRVAAQAWPTTPGTGAFPCP